MKPWKKRNPRLQNAYWQEKTARGGSEAQPAASFSGSGRRPISLQKTAFFRCLNLCGEKARVVSSGIILPVFSSASGKE
jgi:hypothetical protein